MKKIVHAILFIFFFSCASKAAFDHGIFLVGESKGIVNSGEIDEASGLVASAMHSSCFWTHNDSGDNARIFLIDDSARHRATVYLPRVKNRDWEEIAIGPGPVDGKSYVYIGEIGDNFGRHDYKYLYRLPEPDIHVANSPTVDTIQTGIDSIKFRLPDRNRDAEAFFVDPVTKNIYIFSKRERPSINVYVLTYPQLTDRISTATFVMQLPYTYIAAADISADGNEVIIKNYEDVYYWKKKGTESVEELLKTAPAHLPYVREPQGEAVAFAGDGTGYYTLSEKSKGKRPHLMFYRRVDK
jgi:hypothetical protein